MRTLARFVTFSYKTIIVGWILLVAVMAIFAIRLPQMLEGDGFQIDGEHAATMDIVSDTFDIPAETMFIVFDQINDEKIAATIQSVEELQSMSSTPGRR